MNDFFSREQTTVLRGVAALTIILFHVLIAWECHRVVNLPSSMSVAMFLVMSGFGLNESFKCVGLKNYWLQRIRRIVLPWWLFLAVLYVVRGFPGWKAAVSEVLFIDSEFWFMPYIMWCYAAYWIARRLFSESWMMVLALTAFVSINVLQQLAAEQAFSFFAGVWLYEYIVQMRGCSLRRLMTVGVASLMTGLFFLLLKEIPAVHALKYTLTYHYILLMIKLPLAVPLLLLPSLLPRLCKSRLLWLSGIASLELYLVHMPMVNATAHDWFRLVLFIVLTVVLTWAYYQVNNRFLSRLL